jgi:glycosyltransferase involved in cell wall biosynthesis
VRILWLTPYPLTPPMHGGRIRARSLVTQATQLGHTSMVWSVSDDGWAESNALGPAVETRWFPARPRASLPDKLRFAVSRLPEEAWRANQPAVEDSLRAVPPGGIDAAVLVQAHMGAYAPLLTRLGIPWVLDAHNVEWWLTHQLAQQARRLVTRRRLRRDAGKYRRLERSLFGLAPLVVAVSDEDRRRILREASGAHVEVHRSGVDPAYFVWQDHIDVRGASLLMTGTLGYPPNLDAALWMHDELLPAIRRRVPGAELTLVGHAAPAELRRLHSPEGGFRVIGSVPDVRPYLAGADLFVIPLRVGSGTRLKAVEALASGLPIVSTPLGVEGLGLEERGLTLVARDPSEFAQAVDRALQDQNLRRRISTEGRRYVEEFYDWRRIGAAFVDSLQRLASR